MSDADGSVAPSVRIDVDHEAPLKHRLTLELKSELEKRFRKSKGHVRPSLDGAWLDLAVGEVCAPRALHVMDAILLSFEARGHRIEIEQPYPNAQYHEQAGFKTQVVIDGEAIKFHVEELFDGQPPTNASGRRGPLIQYAKGKFSPVGAKGKLALSIDSHSIVGERRVWRDRDKKLVEHYLGDFVVAVERFAAARRRETLERAQVRRAEALEAHRQMIMLKMHERAQKWNAAITLLRFIDSAVRQYQSHDPSPAVAELLVVTRREAESEVQEALDLASLTCSAAVSSR